MKKIGWQKYLSLLLSFVIMFNITMIPVFAEEGNTETAQDQEEQTEAPEETEPEDHVGGEGKYVKDVYIAYGKTEEEAKAWLRKNKWEPLNGNADFNAGKASKFDDDVAAVMGIRRTDKKEEAITDMAVMNMKGGYSFPDYETLLKEKKTDINEFINSFIPVLKEYRANYNGEGSAAGKERATVAHELLNKFYDGDKDDPYAVNDTEKPLGDLFLDKLMQEGNKEGGDMQQIILESSGSAVTMVEVCLALATDAGKETWLERLQELSGDELTENIAKYVPEAEGQDVAPSAVTKLLKQHFGDAAKVLAAQWGDINDDMLWYEEYNEKNDLWQHDGEADEAYEKRISEHFKKEDKEAAAGMSADHEKYIRVSTLYENIYTIPYAGEWGDTLGDFFNPAEGSGYADDTESFLPFAAALSKGQKAAVQLVSLEALLNIGMGTLDSVKAMEPQVKDIFKGTDRLSIYSGINRGIYRGGVALTNKALMEKNQNGYDPFADMWSFDGIYNIVTYSVAAVGLATLGIGFGRLMYLRHSQAFKTADDMAYLYKGTLGLIKKDAGVVEYITDPKVMGLNKAKTVKAQQNGLENWSGKANDLTKSAKVIMGIGGGLLIAASIAKGYQMYRFYNKTFTQIPNYIVDEADIVSYQKNDDGSETKLIDFDQFVYYQAVKCNRQEVGEISDWQDGVSDYASWGCGDAADLNGDFGQQWLALYAVKSDRKGYPVLADSLTLQYGANKMPDGTSKALHMFTYESATDIGDTAYSFNNNKDGVYFFWDVDENAFEDKGTASAFDGGSAALAGGLGLLVGILGTAIVMRKKKETCCQ